MKPLTRNEIRRVISLIAAFCISCVAQAQELDFIQLSQAALVFNVTLKGASPRTNDFSVKAIAQFKSQDGPNLTFPIQLEQSGSKLRSTFFLTDIVPLPAEIGQALRALGLNEVIAVLDTSTKRILVIVPGVKAYLEAPSPPALEDILKDLGRIRFERKPAGEEKLQGFNCKKVQLTEPGKTNGPVVTTWERLDLDRFPMKIHLDRKNDVQMMVQIESVTFFDIDPNWFSAPAGFSKHPSSKSILQAARTGASKSKDSGLPENSPN